MSFFEMFTSITSIYLRIKSLPFGYVRNEMSFLGTNKMFRDKVAMNYRSIINENFLLIVFQ